MKNCLLLLAVVAALVVGGPAYSQYIYVDVGPGASLDGLNSKTNSGLPDDVLSSASTQLDVYIDTAHNRDGSAAACVGTIFSYEFILKNTGGSGSVTFNSWTDNLAFGTNFAQGYCGQAICPSPGSSNEIYVGRGSAEQNLTGLQKLGTMSITVTGSPVLDIMISSVALGGNAQTAYGSSCVGSFDDHTIRLGTDFFDADGTESPTPVEATTWGKIKKLYH